MWDPTESNYWEDDKIINIIDSFYISDKNNIKIFYNLLTISIRTSVNVILCLFISLVVYYYEGVRMGHDGHACMHACMADVWNNKESKLIK